MNTKKELQQKHKVVQLIEDYDFRCNKRKYRKGERFIVWDFDDKCYSISNMGGEYLMKDKCKVIYFVSFESVVGLDREVEVDVDDGVRCKV